jgi:Domain of unknown function (DUF4956)
VPEWLHESFGKEDNVAVATVVTRLAVAFVLGSLVALVYRLTRPRRDRGPTLAPTLILLAVLIAMVTLVIGSSVARAFSLVGALAIVRFRTVVDDPRDTAFVIFAVAVGMGVGAGFLIVPLIGLAFGAAAAVLAPLVAVYHSPFETGNAGHEYTLGVRVGAGHEPDALLNGLFRKHLAIARLVSTGTARQGAALDLTYGVRLLRPGGALALVAELNGLEGVQSVEMRQS